MQLDKLNLQLRGSSQFVNPMKKARDLECNAFSSTTNLIVFSIWARLLLNLKVYASLERNITSIIQVFPKYRYRLFTRTHVNRRYFEQSKEL